MDLVNEEVAIPNRIGPSAGVVRVDHGQRQFTGRTTVGVFNQRVVIRVRTARRRIAGKTMCAERAARLDRRRPGSGTLRARKRKPVVAAPVRLRATGPCGLSGPSHPRPVAVFASHAGEFASKAPNGQWRPFWRCLARKAGSCKQGASTSLHFQYRRSGTWPVNLGSG